MSAAPLVPAGPRNLAPGDPVPGFKLKDVDGKVLDSAAWPKAPSVWLFVSAEQNSSEVAMRDLQAALDSLVGSQLSAAIITSDMVRIPYFRELRSRLRLRVPIVLDGDREIYGRVGVIVLPTTLLIDNDGKLYQSLSGHTLAYKSELESHLSYMTGKIKADELKRRLTTTQPARDTSHDEANRLCRAADLMLQRGLIQEAESELQKAVKVDPASGAACVQLAELRTGQGEFPEAEKLLEEAVRREPANRHVKLARGMLRFKQGNLDEAEKLLYEALLLNPNPTKTHYWLGRVHQAKGNHEKAAEHFRRAIEIAVPELTIVRPKG